MGQATLTVYLAPAGTVMLNPDGTKTTSLVGHAYIVINDGDGDPSVSLGFAPVNEGQASGVIGSAPGTVYMNDNQVYQTPIADSFTENISQDDYTAILNFGLSVNNGTSLAAFGFSPQYQAETNSCVDFLWAALGLIGIPEPSHFGGELMFPQWNMGAVSEAMFNFANVGPIAPNTHVVNQFNPDGTLASSTVEDSDGNVLYTKTYTYSGEYGSNVTTTTTNASGQVTGTSDQKITSSGGAGGYYGSASAEIINPSNGQEVGAYSISTTGSGPTDLTISGQVGELDISGTDISLLANSTSALQGDNNTIAEGAGSQSAVYGTGNSVSTTGADDYVLLQGDGNSIASDGSTGDIFTLNGTNNVVSSTGATINLDSGGSASVVGYENVIEADSGDALVGVIGAGNTIDSGSSVGNAFVFDGTSELVQGYGADILGEAGSSITVIGANNHLDGTSGNVIFGVQGDNNTVNEGSATNDALAFDGTGESVIGSDTDINLYSNTTIGVAGNGDTVDATGTGDAVAISGDSDTVNSSASGQAFTFDGSATLNGSYGTIDLGGSSSLTLNGSSNYIVGSTGDDVTLNGVNTLDLVGDGAGDQVTLDGYSGGSIIVNNAQVFPIGADDRFNVFGYGNLITDDNEDDAVGVNGTGNTIETPGNLVEIDGTGNTVRGDQAPIDLLSGDSTLDILGGQNQISISDSVGHDTVTAGYNFNSFDLGTSTGDLINIEGLDPTVTGGEHDYITLDQDTTLNVDGGAYNTIDDTANGGVLYVTGSDMTILASNTDIFFEGASTDDKVIGIDDTGDGWSIGAYGGGNGDDDGSGDDSGDDGGYGYGGGYDAVEAAQSKSVLANVDSISSKNNEVPNVITSVGDGSQSASGNSTAHIPSAAVTASSLVHAMASFDAEPSAETDLSWLYASQPRESTLTMPHSHF